MASMNLKKLAQATLLTGALTVITADLTPQSWQVRADDHTNHEKGADHSCGEGSCGNKDANKKGSMASCGEGSCGSDKEGAAKGSEGSCGESSCG